MLALIISAWFACPTASARDYTGVISLTVDNDEITGSDNNYTNGGVISWATNEIGTYENDSFVRKWANFWSFLPRVADNDSNTYAAWMLGQEAYTPDKILNPNPPLDDQPYAGVVYLDSLLRTRHERWGHTWKLRLGMVGPSSGADESQNSAHDIVGIREALGWDTQLPDEPFVNVGYAADYLWFDGDLGGSASWRLMPTVDAELGTYLTGLGGGIYGEFGWNLPTAFGGRKLFQGFDPALTVGTGPQKGWSLAFYGGLGGYGIAHFLPLDGNVFRDSRSVDSNPWLGVANAGVSFRYKRLAMNAGVTYYTETFETERERVNFGTFEIAWYF